MTIACTGYKNQKFKIAKSGVNHNLLKISVA